MPQRRFVGLLLAVVATVAACGSSGDSDTGTASATVDGDVVAVGPAPAPLPGDGDAVGAGSLGDAMAVAAGAPDQAAAAACAVDRQTLEIAVETYGLLEGSLPTSQQDLVDAQMIRELSPNFEVGTDGVVITAPGSPCP